MVITKQTPKKVNKKVVQDKIDEIKLDAHVDAIKKGTHTDIASEMKFHSSNINNAFSETIKWAKTEELGKQTQRFMNLLVDGIAVFLDNLIKDKGK